jgi:hypothetical protein
MYARTNKLLVLACMHVCMHICICHPGKILLYFVVDLVYDDVLTTC